MSDVAGDLLTTDDSVNLQSRAIKGAVYTTAAQIIRAVISIVSQLVLGRLLLPAEFGIVAMVAPVLAIIQLFNNLGLSQAVIQREGLTQADVSMLYWMGLGVSSACAVVAMAASPLVALMYHKPQVGPVLIALAVQLPIGALAGHASALMSRKLRFDALAIVEVLSALTGLIASVVFALLHFGYWSLVLGQLFQTSIQATTEWILSGWRPSRPRRSQQAYSMLKFGAGLTGFNLLSMFSMYCDNVLVGILNGAAALGFFDRAFGLVLRPLGSLTAPISRVATPLLSRMVRTPQAYKNAYITMLQGLVMLGAPGMLVGAVMAKPIINLLLGKAWLSTAPIFAPICIAAMFTSLSGSTYWLYTSQNRVGDQVKCGFISSGLILISMLLGLPKGPVGIALSYALFAPLVHGCFIWVATRKGPVTMLDVLAGVVPIIVGLAAAALSLLLLQRLLQSLMLLGLAGAAALSYLVVLGVVALFPSGRTLVKAGIDLAFSRGKQPV